MNYGLIISKGRLLGLSYPLHQVGMMVLVTSLMLWLTTPAAGQGLSRKEAMIGVKKRQKPTATTSAQTGPRISRAALITSTIEVRLIKGIAKTLMQMRNIVKKLPDRSPQKLEVMKKMLQLQLEQAAYITSKEHDAYEAKWNAWDAKGRKDVEPKVSHTKSLRLWQKFVKLSREVAQEYPKNPELDKLLYNLALGLQFLEQEEAAAQVLEKLIKDFPNSPIAGDVYYSLGDHYFNRNQYSRAEKNYKKVIVTYKQSKRYLWSMFKLGWTYYNLNNYRRAITYWKQTISLAKSGNKSALLLRDEALRDIVLAFAEVGDTQAAVSYFRANGGTKYVNSFLQLLANTFIDQGKFQQAIDTLKKIQTISPSSPEAPKAQSTLIILAFELGDFEMLWRQLRLYAVKYAKDSPWARSNASRPRLLLETDKDIRELMLYHAKIIHKNAQQQKSARLTDEAAKGYQLFLKHYPRAKRFYEVTYNLADLYYFQKKYTLAGRLYLELNAAGKDKAVIYNDDGKPIRNIHKESSEYMLDSFYKAYEPELKQILAAKEPLQLGAAQQPLSHKASNFIRACGTFIRSYPNHQKIKQNCHVYIAETYLRHHHRDNALKYLWIVAREYSTAAPGPKAVESLIPLYENDSKNLNLAVLELMKIPAYQEGRIGTKLRQLLRGVNEETVNQENDAIQRAKGLLKLAAKYPDYKEVYKYYFNAAVAFLEGGDYVSALKADQVVVNRFKHIPQAEASLMRMAEMSAIMVHYQAALKYYQLFISRYPQSKQISTAILQSCDLAIVVAHNPSKILKDCSYLARTDPGAYRARVEDLLSTYLARRDSSSLNVVANHYLGLGVDIPTQINVHYKMYVLTGRSLQAPQSAKYAAKIMSLYQTAQAAVQQNALARQAVAELLFAQAAQLKQSYHRLKLRGGTIQQVQKSIETKTMHFQRFENALKKVIAVGDPTWGVGALYEIGYAWENFGNLYANPPGIKGAKPAEVKQQLAPSAEQAYATATMTYRKALADAQKFSVYSDYHRRVGEAISRLNGKNITAGDWVLMPDFLGSPASPQAISSHEP